MSLQVDKRAFPHSEKYMIYLIFVLNKVCFVIVELIHVSFMLLVNEIAHQIPRLSNFEEYFFDESCVPIFVCKEGVRTEI